MDIKAKYQDLYEGWFNRKPMNHFYKGVFIDLLAYTVGKLRNWDSELPDRVHRGKDFTTNNLFKLYILAAVKKKIIELMYSYARRMISNDLNDFFKTMNRENELDIMFSSILGINSSDIDIDEIKTPFEKGPKQTNRVLQFWKCIKMQTNPLQFKIIYRRLKSGSGYKAIAEEFGITPDRARQVYSRKKDLIINCAKTHLMNND